MLQRIRDLKVQSLNDTLAPEDKDAIAAEVAQLGTEITKIGSDTAFNGTTLLDGTTALNFQVGANDGETIAASKVDLAGGSAVSVVLGASDATTLAAIGVSDIDAAINDVSTGRAAFGA